MPMADKSKSWNAKNYILAALGGSLAATAIVVIASVILSPGHISFTITRASRSPSSDGSKVYLNFTVAAEIRQPSPKVKYQSLVVDVDNSTSTEGRYSIEAQVETQLPGEYLPGPNVTSIDATVGLVGANLAWYSASHRKNESVLNVVVTSEVRFKVGVARTRMYDIKVSCPAVHFSDIPSNSTAPAVNFTCHG